MNDVDRTRAIELAAPLLRISPAEASCDESAEIDGFYVWQPVRGGAQVLVGRDGALLYGNSSLDYGQMVAAYRTGRRTELRDPEGR